MDNGSEAPGVVVVTGAGTGIGRAVTRRLVADGFRVVAVGRRRQPLEETADGLEESVDVVAADVSTEAGASLVSDHLARTGSAARGVVAAAGGLAAGDGAQGGLTALRADWQASFESNVMTAVMVVEAMRPMLERDGGRVVLLSSVAALRGSGGGPYGAMKAALHAWMFDLARELGEHGGTANVVAPGFVPDTEFWAGRLTPERRSQRAAQTLVGREGTPQEVASLIAWLLSEDAGWVTGQVLSPNGGVVLGR